MPKRRASKVPEKSVAELQPDELGELKRLVKEFIGKIESIDNEIELLKGDRSEVIEEYSERLDMKTLKAALQIVKIQNGVAHRDAFDCFMEVLTSDAGGPSHEEG